MIIIETKLYTSGKEENEMKINIYDLQQKYDI